MPSKKKKYNARFPAGRIKKIMQTDEEIGKVAQAVPVIISRTLELFVESLLTKSTQITQARNAKTLTPSHMKQCILSESRFDFLKDLVKNIPDASIQEDNENNAMFDTNSDNKTDDIEMVVNQIKGDSSPEMCSPKLEIAADYYTEQSSSSSRTPVIQYGPKIAQTNTSPSSDSKINFSVKNILKPDSDEPKLHITIASEEVPSGTATTPTPNSPQKLTIRSDNVPPLIPISHNLYGQNVGDNLCIDEDYDN